ncbi:MAG: phosphate starvation-inducible protein PhoH [Phormidesmis priestleyi]|uniref:Phosphate starvation-inducible protein PhoH n=1 Tax=Phormidesmis priestleyi TaxID=268141 RepID=A0A2W4XAS4_9CYAN|nr:MAG: phosphate starvation-inducible protein PhoH [Phormidesmis priestleyi]
MKKFYVLDTNVLLHDPNALLRFEDNDVVLPITVIEELDRFKKRPEETGRNARQTSRMLDGLRQKGSLTEGIELANGGRIRVALCHRETLDNLPAELYSGGGSGDGGDNAILAVALEVKQQCDCPVVMVSKDTNMRIKADTLGLAAEDYETDKIDVDDLYTGMGEVLVSPEQMNDLFQSGNQSAEAFPQLSKRSPNQALTLIDINNPSHTALATLRPDGQLVPLPKIPYSGVSRIHARNREQRFALALLLNDAIPLVTLVGKAGTGKTLLAIAAGLQKVAEEKRYTRLLISRPVMPMGKDIGYLPGDMTEKLTPWMQPLYDNFDLIFNTQDGAEKPDHWRRGHEELMDLGLLQIEALTYIRGRTIPKQFFVIDEAQNLTPHEVKTILTRAGEGTKIVLTGDTAQIDNPYVDAASNGLTYVIERFRNEPLAGHITLYQGERSDLAARAAALL